MRIVILCDNISILSSDIAYLASLNRTFRYNTSGIQERRAFDSVILSFLQENCGLCAPDAG